MGISLVKRLFRRAILKTSVTKAIGGDRQPPPKNNRAIESVPKPKKKRYRGKRDYRWISPEPVQRKKITR
jgi:hypothetical protein